MTINPETEVVESRFDAATKTHTYVVGRHAKRWTVSIPDEEFAQFGPVMGADGASNKARRRHYLATKLSMAMEGPADV